MSQKVAVAYIVHDDHYYLTPSIESFSRAGPILVFLSKTPWHGEAGDWKQTEKIAREAGAEVVLGEWRSELEHRQAVHAYCAEHGLSHVLIPDGDEIVEPALLEPLLKIAESNLADRVYVEWDTYWKSAEYVIRPREPFRPAIMVSIANAIPVGGRNFEGGRPLFLGSQYGIIHHLSYAGPEERIKRKLECWGHRNEVAPDWYDHIYREWDRNKLLRNLHPTHPQNYHFAERIEPPPILRSVAIRQQNAAGWQKPDRWPSISVVIPVHNGREDLEACLQSLDSSADLICEVVIVDNGSEPDTFQGIELRRCVNLIRNSENLGFPKACNQGIEASAGDVIVFLNSDTIVSRPAIIRLMESLRSSANVAATGPYTNNSAHFQRIEPTYTSLDTHDLFAEDFANREVEDEETDMLVGFCLAVKRSVLDEVGAFDERFGLGTFEDNDLCYRMRRAGYRLLISSRSFIHHTGSKTLTAVVKRPQDLLAANERKFRHKWRDDLESGFASHLSGMAHERIRFDPGSHPNVRERQARNLSRKAKVSLCMIVKNEERVLGECLESAKPFFSQMIVVDTGSTDRTMEIAREKGAEVHEFPWTDSFADARNESLKYATGDWVFWMDADDTLPFSSGMEILKAAIGAPKHVTAFVVPVQFLEGDPNVTGTRVDHVKLFRNGKGIRFEGRIHEQNLQSIRELGGEVDRCGAIVLHSGYDMSKEGQARKHERNMKLLLLDLNERPGHPFVQFCAGMEYHFNGEHEKAIEHLSRSIELSGIGDTILRKSWALLAASLAAIGRNEEALEAFRKGIVAVGIDPDLCFGRAKLLHSMGRREEAIENYLRATQANLTAHFSSFDIGILTHKSYHNLGSIYLELDRYDDARQMYLNAMSGNPSEPGSAFPLFQAALQRQDFQTAHLCKNHVLRTTGLSEIFCQMEATWFEAIEGPGAGIAALQRIVEQHPSEGPMLVLARELINRGQIPQGVPLLLQLNNFGNPEAAFFLGSIEAGQENYDRALAWMRRALELNPGHEETQARIAELESLSAKSS